MCIGGDAVSQWLSRCPQQAPHKQEVAASRRLQVDTQSASYAVTFTSANEILKNQVTFFQVKLDLYVM
ncbi:unnamed protein product [Arctogadus glacialis]